MWLKKLNLFLASLLAVVTMVHYAPIQYISRDLRPYYNQYMFFTENVCKEDQYWKPYRMVVLLGKLQTPVVGQCSYRYPFEFIVTIDEKYFNGATEVERLEVMAHELRHCFFRAEHSDYPFNYMYSELPDLSKSELEAQIFKDLQTSCER